MMRGHWLSCNFSVLVVKIAHLVVILINLVVKIVVLVVIVKLWNSMKRVSLTKKGFWLWPKVVIGFYDHRVKINIF